MKEKCSICGQTIKVSQSVKHWDGRPVLEWHYYDFTDERECPGSGRPFEEKKETLAVVEREFRKAFTPNKHGEYA
jgi:hypothetical protein